MPYFESALQRRLPGSAGVGGDNWSVNELAHVDDEDDKNDISTH